MTFTMIQSSRLFVLKGGSSSHFPSRCQHSAVSLLMIRNSHQCSSSSSCSAVGASTSNSSNNNSISSSRLIHSSSTPLLYPLSLQQRQQQQQQQQQQTYYFSSTSDHPARPAVRRRARPNFGHYKAEDVVPLFKKKNSSVKNAYALLGGLQEPYNYDGNKPTEDYLELTSLSPWVPAPDPVARKMLDLAQVTPNDIHVDLGSGDGRVNFHAIDMGICKSIGIDIDEGIIKVAKERLMKRHPQPDLEFIVADLLDEQHEAWNKVETATIITMFFVSDALKQLRPILERKLIGRDNVRIITCGYEMTGWHATVMETILGTTVYVYEWGKTQQEEDDDEEILLYDEALMEQSKLQEAKGGRMDKFPGTNNANKHVEHYTSVLPGYDPHDRNSDDAWDDYWDDEEEDELDDDDEEQKREKTKKITKDVDDDDDDIMRLVEKHSGNNKKEEE